MIGLLAQMPTRYLAQFAVNQRHQRIQRGLIPLLPMHEQLAHFVG